MMGINSKAIAAMHRLMGMTRDNPYVLSVGCTGSKLIVYLRERESFHEEAQSAESVARIPPEVDGYPVDIITTGAPYPL